MSPSDRIEVVVKPNNRYGEAKAGDTLMVTRREMDMHPHCLEVAKPITEGPRTAVVVLPADRAAALGLPLGRRKEGPVAFEVTRLKPDGKPQLPLRAELGAPGLAGAMKVRGLFDAVNATAEAMGYDPASDGEMAAYVERNIARCIGAYRDLLSEAEKNATDRVVELHRAQDEVVALRQALRVSQEETQAARDEATRLAQELAQFKAPEAVAEQAQAKGRSK